MAQNTALMELKQWVDDNYPNFNKADIEAKIDELFQHPVPATGKNKPFIVANVKDILELMDKEEISYSRGVEMFNEVAANYYSQHPVPVPDGGEIKGGHVFECFLTETGNKVWKFNYTDGNGLNQHSGVYFKESHAIKGLDDFNEGLSTHPVPDGGDKEQMTNYNVDAVFNAIFTPPSQPAGNDAVSVEEIMSDLWDKYSDGGTITKGWFDRIIDDFIKTTK